MAKVLTTISIRGAPVMVAVAPIAAACMSKTIAGIRHEPIAGGVMSG